MTLQPSVQTAYALARERFAELGVDTDAALKTLDAIPISLHCWQGDDVRGFENPDGDLTGGIQVSGSYPGRARTASQLRADLDFALQQIPGAARLNLHAIYLEADKPVERDAIQPEHFRNWVTWAKQRGLGLDFNPTYFSHPLSAQGLTLTHPSAEVRRFWIDHGLACRAVSEYFGKELGSPSVMNIWIPDGTKDQTPDRLAPRLRLIEALDAIVTPDLGDHHKLAVEGKLFGIGAESYTVGSNDFYLAYAATRKASADAGCGTFPSDRGRLRQDFHRPLLRRGTPAACVPAGPLGQRPCRAPRRSDAGDRERDRTLRRAGADQHRSRFLRRQHQPDRGLGDRNAKHAQGASPSPSGTERRLADADARFDGAEVMALFEEQKSMPWSAVWDFYCATKDVPVGLGWLTKVRAYEADILSKRESA